MGGFLTGSLTLIATYVLLQQGSAEGVAAGGNFIAAFARRMLSPQVAGVAQLSDAASAASLGEAAGRAAKTAAGIINNRRGGIASGAGRAAS